MAIALTPKYTCPMTRLRFRTTQRQPKGPEAYGRKEDICAGMIIFVLVVQSLIDIKMTSLPYRGQKLMTKITDFVKTTIHPLSNFLQITVIPKQNVPPLRTHIFMLVNFVVLQMVIQVWGVYTALHPIMVIASLHL